MFQHTSFLSGFPIFFFRHPPPRRARDFRFDSVSFLRSSASRDISSVWLSSRKPQPARNVRPATCGKPLNEKPIHCTRVTRRIWSFSGADKTFDRGTSNQLRYSLSPLVPPRTAGYDIADVVAATLLPAWISDARDGRQDCRRMDRLVDPHIFCKYSYNTRHTYIILYY